MIVVNLVYIIITRRGEPVCSPFAPERNYEFRELHEFELHKG